jgi:hypothetical protein
MVAAKLHSADHFCDCVSSVEKVGTADANREMATWALCKTVRLLLSHTVEHLWVCFCRKVGMADAKTEMPTWHYVH